MQFKLLNFHKLLGGFATSLVGTFIPLIIYKATGSIRLAALFIIGECFSRFVFNHLFRKLYIDEEEIARKTKSMYEIYSHEKECYLSVKR